MKVLFINPRNTKPRTISKHCYPPFGLLYLAAYLKDEMHEVKIIDANALGLDNKQIVARTDKFKPDLVGMSLIADLLSQVHSLIRDLALSQHQVKFILGGPEVNARPKKVLEEFDRVDFAIQGEGERAIVELCRALENKGRLEDVPGLYYRIQGGIVHNKGVVPIEDLDSLKYPDRDCLDEVYLQKKYYSILVRGRPVDGISTSRGCPFRCRFCYSTNRIYRTRSPESVLDELNKIYLRGVRYIRFYDDNFTFDRSRAMRIFDLIVKNKMNIGLEIKSRADGIDEELLIKAKRAGVCQFSYGMESGSQRILDSMRKGITVRDIISACELTKKAKIRCHTSWLLGFPGETPETIEDTIRLITRLRPTTASFTVLKPYPQTDIYCEAKNNGTLIGDWSVKDDYIPWIKLPWINSKAGLFKYLYSTMRKIYFSPYYVGLYSGMIIKNLNTTMGRYAWQEAVNCGRGLLKTCVLGLQPKA